LKNIAFIDGQNLHMGTVSNNWKIDYVRFRVYLKEKYHVSEAYYFLGYLSGNEDALHRNLQKAGFILIFKEHQLTQLSTKKGNVDSDIIFEIMKKLYEDETFNKIVLVSSDGDYKKVVDHLITKNKFEKILFPTNKHSFLYKNLGSEYFDYLNQYEIKEKIRYLPHSQSKRKRAP
jgi:uncharacterized LabA/DUF88 family protein